MEDVLQVQSSLARVAAILGRVGEENPLSDAALTTKPAALHTVERGQQQCSNGGVKERKMAFQSPLRGGSGGGGVGLSRAAQGNAVSWLKQQQQFSQQQRQHHQPSSQSGSPASSALVVGAGTYSSPPQSSSGATRSHSVRGNHVARMQSSSDGYTGKRGLTVSRLHSTAHARREQTDAIISSDQNWQPQHQEEEGTVEHSGVHGIRMAHKKEIILAPGRRSMKKEREGVEGKSGMTVSTSTTTTTTLLSSPRGYTGSQEKKKEEEDVNGDAASPQSGSNGEEAEGWIVVPAGRAYNMWSSTGKENGSATAKPPSGRHFTDFVSAANGSGEDDRIQGGEGKEVLVSKQHVVYMERLKKVLMTAERECIAREAAALKLARQAKMEREDRLQLRLKRGSKRVVASASGKKEKPSTGNPSFGISNTNRSICQLSTSMSSTFPLSASMTSLARYQLHTVVAPITTNESHRHKQQRQQQQQQQRPAGSSQRRASSTSPHQHQQQQQQQRDLTPSTKPQDLSLGNLSTSLLSNCTSTALDVTLGSLNGTVPLLSMTTRGPISAFIAQSAGHMGQREDSNVDDEEQGGTHAPPAPLPRKRTLNPCAAARVGTKTAVSAAVDAEMSHVSNGSHDSGVARRRTAKAHVDDVNTGPLGSPSRRRTTQAGKAGVKRAFSRSGSNNNNNNNNNNNENDSSTSCMSPHLPLSNPIEFVPLSSSTSVSVPPSYTAPTAQGGLSLSTACHGDGANVSGRSTSTLFGALSMQTTATTTPTTTTTAASAFMLTTPCPTIAAGATTSDGGGSLAGPAFISAFSSVIPPRHSRSFSSRQPGGSSNSRASSARGSSGGYSTSVSTMAAQEWAERSAAMRLQREREQQRERTSQVTARIVSLMREIEEVRRDLEEKRVQSQQEVRGLALSLHAILYEEEDGDDDNKEEAVKSLKMAATGAARSTAVAVEKVAKSPPPTSFNLPTATATSSSLFSSLPGSPLSTTNPRVTHWQKGTTRSSISSISSLSDMSAARSPTSPESTPPFLQPTFSDVNAEATAAAAAAASLVDVEVGVHPGSARKAGAGEDRQKIAAVVVVDDDDDDEEEEGDEEEGQLVRTRLFSGSMRPTGIARQFESNSSADSDSRGAAASVFSSSPPPLQQYPQFIAEFLASREPAVVRVSLWGLLQQQQQEQQKQRQQDPRQDGIGENKEKTEEEEEEKLLQKLMMEASKLIVAAEAQGHSLPWSAIRADDGTAAVAAEEALITPTATKAATAEARQSFLQAVGDPSNDKDTHNSIGHNCDVRATEDCMLTTPTMAVSNTATGAARRRNALARGEEKDPLQDKEFIQFVLRLIRISRDMDSADGGVGSGTIAAATPAAAAAGTVTQNNVVGVLKCALRKQTPVCKTATTATTSITTPSSLRGLRSPITRGNIGGSKASAATVVPEGSTRVQDLQRFHDVIAKLDAYVTQCTTQRQVDRQRLQAKLDAEYATALAVGASAKERQAAAAAQVRRQRRAALAVIQAQCAELITHVLRLGRELEDEEALTPSLELRLQVVMAEHAEALALKRDVVAQEEAFMTREGQRAEVVDKGDGGDDDDGVTAAARVAEAVRNTVRVIELGDILKRQHQQLQQRPPIAPTIYPTLGRHTRPAPLTAADPTDTFLLMKQVAPLYSSNNSDCTADQKSRQSLPRRDNKKAATATAGDVAMSPKPPPFKPFPRPTSAPLIASSLPSSPSQGRQWKSKDMSPVSSKRDTCSSPHSTSQQQHEEDRLFSTRQYYARRDLLDSRLENAFTMSSTLHHRPLFRNLYERPQSSPDEAKKESQGGAGEAACGTSRQQQQQSPVLFPTQIGASTFLDEPLRRTPRRSVPPSSAGTERSGSMRKKQQVPSFARPFSALV